MRSIKEMDKRLDEREQEIERLNNIITELEHWIINNKHNEKVVGTLVVDYGDLLYKLKELKEN